jgi:hypothetical protein
MYETPEMYRLGCYVIGPTCAYHPPFDKTCRTSKTLTLNAQSNDLRSKGFDFLVKLDEFDVPVEAVLSYLAYVVSYRLHKIQFLASFDRNQHITVATRSLDFKPWEGNLDDVPVESEVTPLGVI